MKVKKKLKSFKDELLKFLKESGDETTDDDWFYIMIGDNYIAVDMKYSYWYHEDDGTVVFRVNEY